MHSGHQATGKYLAIVKVANVIDNASIYSGKSCGPDDYANIDGDMAGDPAIKHFRIMIAIKRDGTVEIATARR